VGGQINQPLWGTANLIGDTRNGVGSDYKPKKKHPLKRAFWKSLARTHAIRMVGSKSKGDLLEKVRNQEKRKW